VESRLLLDVVVGKGAAVLKLLSGEDETLLVRGNSLLVWAALAWYLRFPTATRNVPWILDFTLSMVSEDSTSRVIVLPVRVFTKICMAAWEGLAELVKGTVRGSGAERRRIHQTSARFTVPVCALRAGLAYLDNLVVFLSRQYGRFEGTGRHREIKCGRKKSCAGSGGER
jgi:hypothetical protein